MRFPGETERGFDDVKTMKLGRHLLGGRDTIIETHSKEGVEPLHPVPGEVERLRWGCIYPQKQGGDAFIIGVKIPGEVPKPQLTKLILQDHNKETIFDEPIRDLHGASLEGCEDCAGFTGYTANLSVGSADGNSPVLIRAEESLADFEYIRPKLKTREPGRPEALDNLDVLYKRGASGSLKRTFDPDAPSYMDYEEYLDRDKPGRTAPAEHEAARC